MAKNPNIPARRTALGDFVGMFPDRNANLGWHVVTFNRHGHWTSSRMCATEHDAKASRRAIFKLHKQLAHEAFVRAAKRRAGRSS